MRAEIALMSGSAFAVTHHAFSLSLIHISQIMYWGQDRDKIDEVMQLLPVFTEFSLHRLG